MNNNVTIWKLIRSDLRNYGGTSFPKACFFFFFSPSFRLLLNYRVGVKWYKSRYKFFKALAIILKYRQTIKFGCNISYDAVLGQHIRFPHPIGIVIGNDVHIDDNVSIWQQVTLGRSDGAVPEYPVVKSGTKIYAGAKIIGNITIGNNCIIGANSVVNCNIPDYSIAAGIPARIIRKIDAENIDAN